MSIYDEMRNYIEVLYGRDECGYNAYSDMVDYIDEAGADYDRLVDVLHEVETEAVYAYHCLQQDCATATNSSEHFFKKWWHAECELDRTKSENAKLRELCSALYEFAYDEYPDSAELNFADRMRELGVEVK